MIEKGHLTDWLTCRRFERDKMAKNHFFYQMAAADRAEGGQVEPVLGRLSLFKSDPVFNQTHPTTVF
jgi:hypothetical protein